uniref:Uncharacterized protein n=1 Tax=Brassica oleracea TaxID=3712 RepID=A0A3P6F7S2_BRAOL|nr:unnamed protein product [Brassica oleracea]
MEPTLLSLSYWYGSGHEKRDLWMMLMFLVFAIAMRMPCLYSRCTNGNGVLYTGLYVGLICVGNAVKWVACVVSYHACRTRVSEKKDDEDQKLRGSSAPTEGMLNPLWPGLELVMADPSAEVPIPPDHEARF